MSLPSERNLPWVYMFVGGIVAVLIVFAMVVPIVAQQKRQAAFPEIGAARHDGPELLEKLGLPPETEATGFRTVESGPRRNNAWDADTAWMSWTHPHATTRDFAGTTEWYAAKLLAEGWKTHRAVEAESAEFCRPDWRMKLTRTARGYDLRLEWNNRFSAEPCQHP